MAFFEVPLFGNDEGADRERLNQLIANQNHLNQNKVPIWFRAHGTVKTDNLKIAAGMNHANNANGVTRTRWINMGNFFVPGSYTIPVASFSTLTAVRSFVTIAERTRESVQPDNTGFSCQIRSNDDTKLAGPNYITWIVIGY